MATMLMMTAARKGHGRPAVGLSNPTVPVQGTSSGHEPDKHEPEARAADVACDPFAWAGLEGRPYTFTTPEPS